MGHAPTHALHLLILRHKGVPKQETFVGLLVKQVSISIGIAPVYLTVQVLLFKTKNHKSNFALTLVVKLLRIFFIKTNLASQLVHILSVLMTSLEFIIV